MFTSCNPKFRIMLHTLLLLCLSTLAAALPSPKHNEHHSLHDTYSRSLMLARKIHQDVQYLLLPYEEQLGIKDSHVSSLFMKGVPSCEFNYTDWLSLEEAVRLQQASEYLLVFNNHVDACCTSEHQPGAETSLELLLLDMRDLQALVTQQLTLLQQPEARLSAALPAPLCSRESAWLGRVEGYLVLQGLEKCAQKVVRDYTLLRRQLRQ